MADIPIQRKENRNIWPWIIGLIVLLALAWYLLGRRHNDTAATPAMTDSTATTTVAPAPGTATPGTATPGTTTPATPATPGTATPRTNP